MRRRSFAFLLVAIFFATTSYAAKVGRITREDAFVYDLPDESSPTHFKLGVGDIVTISDYPTRGFYKVRTEKGVTGWLISNAVLVGEDSKQPAPVIPHYEDAPSSAPPTPAKNESDSHAMSVKIFTGGDFASLKEANQLVGTTLFNSVSYYGIEFGYSLYEDIDLLLRAEVLSKTSSVENTSFKVSSFPVMVGLGYKAFSWERFTISGAMLLGYSSNTGLTETASSLPAPNVTEFSANTFTEMFRVSLDLRVARWFGLYGEFGYRFLKTPSVTPDQSGAGSSVFQSNGSFVPIPLNLSGAFGGGGLKFNF